MYDSLCTGEEEMEDLPNGASWSNPAPVMSAVSKGKQKQTSGNEDPFPSRERGTALPRPAPTNLSRDWAVSRTRKNLIPDCDDDNDSDWKMSDNEYSQEDEDLGLEEENDEPFEQEKSSSSASSHNPIESSRSMEEDLIDNTRNDKPEGALQVELEEF
ncbi:uncharacterized protein MELLADRAFT_112147 [Melampsora larici-populina 98AG31]|uniref:Uncharacterized protein n=1 Tax=Melampsora larici-populina (strain 98AG31 / pathotype 3-4-7) TaxID=747676 RepID=F4S5J2_MELLP|nr:uncharacterized protein MELLADRAFT_112147 [Melampsora larici-populina 98AG31]EGG00034.1 hypothetical protein MELLADRAFT_112147 [Melampsora larici-populina 98AG31]